MSEKVFINNEFWRGKRIFLTGHTGFKGSWLSLWLAQMGAKVHGYALPPATMPNLFDLAGVRAQIASHHIGDVADLSALRNALRESKADIVIHMAAQALVRQGYMDPVGTYRTNVMGTVNILEAARQVDFLKAVLIVTTDKCYENVEETRGYCEGDRIGGRDPYSNSKACAELVTDAYRRSFFESGGPLVSSARAGNVIGGGDWSPDRLVPDIMLGFMGDRVPLVRSPAAVRPWQHVLEPLSGYLTLCERLYFSQRAFACGWNFGPAPSDAKEVSWIVERLAKLWGRGAGWKRDTANHPHEASYLYLDTSKAELELGYAPRWDLDLALKKIVDWYSAYVNKEDMAEVTRSQIQEFARTYKISKEP